MSNKVSYEALEREQEKINEQLKQIENENYEKIITMFDDKLKTIETNLPIVKKITFNKEYIANYLLAYYEIERTSHGPYLQYYRRIDIPGPLFIIELNNLQYVTIGASSTYTPGNLFDIYFYPNGYNNKKPTETTLSNHMRPQHCKYGAYVYITSVYNRNYTDLMNIYKCVNMDKFIELIDNIALIYHNIEEEIYLNNKEELENDNSYDGVYLPDRLISTKLRHLFYRLQNIEVPKLKETTVTKIERC